MPNDTASSTAPTVSPAPKGVAWQQTVVMRNTQNQEEAFSIGPDGCVWSFIAGTDASTQRLENLGLEADFLTVGRNSAGTLVVIAAKGLQTTYRTEIAQTSMVPPAERWSVARSIHLPTIQGATGVRRLYTQSDFSGMRIAMIVDTQTQELGSSYVMACSQWRDNGPGPFILLPPLGTQAQALAGKPSGSGGLKMFRAAHST